MQEHAFNRILFLASIFSFLLALSSKKIFGDSNWTILSQGFGSSVLAAIFGLYFFDWRNSLRLQRIANLIKTSHANGDGIIAIRKNAEFDLNFWINSVRSIATHPESVYFCGNKLFRWRSVPDYRDPLFELLQKRIERAKKKGAKGNEWKTYICVTDDEALNKWKSEIEENLKGGKNFIETISVPQAKMLYSAVVTGEMLIITPYTRKFAVQECLSFSVTATSSIGKLYRSDLIDLVKECKPNKDSPSS